VDVADLAHFGFELLRRQDLGEEPPKLLVDGRQRLGGLRIARVAAQDQRVGADLGEVTGIEGELHRIGPPD
jgi:hypothetical protein